jgi:predicted house-cleaning noncanonical NTP pyrophosphatase (MazG superfamily)
MATCCHLGLGGRTIAFQAMRLDYHKLVRDEIPRIIEAGGGQPVTRVLDQAGYLVALRAKLIEEAEEAQAAPDGQLRSELADVLEVLQALAAADGMSWGSGPGRVWGCRGRRAGWGASCGWSQALWPPILWPPRAYRRR